MMSDELSAHSTQERRIPHKSAHKVTVGIGSNIHIDLIKALTSQRSAF
jgi:hypothetical protein